MPLIWLEIWHLVCSHYTLVRAKNFHVSRSQKALQINYNKDSFIAVITIRRFSEFQSSIHSWVHVSERHLSRV